MGIIRANRYGPLHFSQVNRYLNGVYYVASQHAECGPWYILDGKLGRLVKAFSAYAKYGNSAVSVGSAACLPLRGDSIDYIFTDPPFGENIYYADLNSLSNPGIGSLPMPSQKRLSTASRRRTCPNTMC